VAVWQAETLSRATGRPFDGFSIRGRFLSPWRHRLIRDECTVLDYGCGGRRRQPASERGAEGRRLGPLLFGPDAPPKSADVVNLGYVLNVIEDPAERTKRCARHTRSRSARLSSRCGSISPLDKGIPFQDGLITSRGAFQKIYTQSEFRQFVGETLDVRPHVRALGVTYAFKDRAEEEEYVAHTAFSAHGQLPEERRRGVRGGTNWLRPHRAGAADGADAAR